jgi:hypothetical protein
MKNYPGSIKSFDEIIEEFELVLSGKAISFNEIIEREPNRKFVLELVASFEAKTVFYYRNIVKRKKILSNGNIPEITKKVIKNHKKHLMLTPIESIFLYTIQPQSNTAYFEFLALVDYRNWLAHGRGWEYETKWNKFDFQFSLNTIFSLFALMPDYPAFLKD